MKSTFKEIIEYLVDLGYKKQDIVDKRYMKHFVAFYYYLKRRERRRGWE